ncbi:MAG: mechanosensitive ion channel family protein [Chitinophagales bacterium]|nr:mechanosensitive ion channel family protein [Chitinophagales bacterium]
MYSFPDYRILDNSIKNILWFLLIAFIAFIFKRYVSRLIGNLIFRLFRRYRSAEYAAIFEERMLKPIELFILLLIIEMGVQLTYPGRWHLTIMGHSLHLILNELMESVLLLSFAWILLRLVDFISYILKQRTVITGSRVDDQLVPFIKDALKILIIVSGFFVILSAIFGFDITSLLAGLGIGGLAVAFAAQESIKDLFGSFTIFWDKPFVTGDLVTIENVTGTVEKVGIRSTRIRTADKTFVTMPNKKMVDSNVDNLTLRTYRKVDITIGITYETKHETLQKIITELNDYFSNRNTFPEENFVIFDSFGESSLNIRIQYFIPINPWLDFLKMKENVNFKIMEVIVDNKASFAYPVRNIRFNSESFDGNASAGFEN